MKTDDVKKLYEEYILPTYSQSPVCLVKGKGSRVWDVQDKEYIDLFPGWAVSGIGHCHPEVVNAVKEQARKILHIPNNYYNLKQAQLAQAISEASFPARVFFCNSGAESTDSAIKFARRYGSDEGRYEIVTMKKSFHGRTFAGIACTGQDKVRQGFSPELEGFRYADFNDLDSVKAQVNDKTVAIFLEPIQGEGGVNVASKEFMQGLRDLCDEKNLLLIFDEVQTAMGRTGDMFAYQYYGIEPDVMTLAKSLGGGAPIGALVVNKRVNKEVFVPGTHGSTFGGNPLVTAAALATFRAIKKEKLIENARLMGKYFGDRLDQIVEKYAVVKSVKGLGLMRALELDCPGAPIVDKAIEKGLLINCTQESILRIFPAINITKGVLDKGLKILEDILQEAPVKV